MGAMSRSYRARSGGLANELCLLGREEVPSLVGDIVLLTKLVMLWQLLWREGSGINQRTGRAGSDSPLTLQCSSAWRRQVEAAQRAPAQPPSQLHPFSSLSGNFHRTVSTDRNCRVNQLHTTAYISMEFFYIIKCPRVLLKGFNYILVRRNCVQANVRTIRISCSHQADRRTAPRPINLWAGGRDKTRRVLASTSASGQPPGSHLNPAQHTGEAPLPTRWAQLARQHRKSGQLKCGCRAWFFVF